MDFARKYRRRIHGEGDPNRDRPKRSSSKPPRRTAAAIPHLLKIFAGRVEEPATLEPCLIELFPPRHREAQRPKQSIWIPTAHRPHLPSGIQVVRADSR